LLSMWYVQREAAKRNAVFYLMGNGSSGFRGVYAYGLMQTGNNGLGGFKRPEESILLRNNCGYGRSRWHC
jgi:hypothetical protein